MVYNFGQGGPDDGVLPDAGVVLDRHGNIFGTTEDGGGKQCDGFGCGTVYVLNGQTGAETILLHLDGTGMKFPLAPVLLSRKSHVFGTFVSGGDAGAPGCQNGVPGCGGVFKLAR